MSCGGVGRRAHVESRAKEVELNFAQRACTLLQTRWSTANAVDACGTCKAGRTARSTSTALLGVSEVSAAGARRSAARAAHPRGEALDASCPSAACGR